MKKLVYILSIIFITIGCQKVIDVDLNDAEQQIVIVGTYSANDSTVKVKVTLTSSYFDSNPSDEVDNANITIYDHLGNATNVPYIDSGIYQLNQYTPNLGTNYTLEVAHNGSLYTADCNLNPPVLLAPILYDSIPPSLFNSNGGYVVYATYDDPTPDVNYFQIVLIKNGKVRDKLNQVITQDDKLTDGNTVSRPLFDKFFDFSDTVGMELRSIDERIYNYLNQAISTALNQGSSAPGNPTSNWNNGALGYFSAYSSSNEEVIIL